MILKLKKIVKNNKMKEDIKEDIKEIVEQYFKEIGKDKPLFNDYALKRIMIVR